MKLDELANTVREHNGEFLCKQIRDEQNTRLVRFRHDATPPCRAGDIPDIGRLRDFYDTFGSILFYYDAQSQDAARYIAPPSEWAELQDQCAGWIDMLDEDDRPQWIGTGLVIGETPHSGNYILMAREGPSAGHVFELDHDGLVFTDAANDLVDYVEKLLALDAEKLTDMASHMRFVAGDPMVQWWIVEMRDNRGCVVRSAI